MFVIRVILDIVPEYITLFENRSKEESRIVRDVHSGCRHYEFFRAPDQPGRYMLYEEWQDETSFRRYKESDLFGKIGQRLRPLLSSPPDSAYFDANPVPVK